MLGPILYLLGLLFALGLGYFFLLNQTPISVVLLPGLPPRSAFVGELVAYAAMAGGLVMLLLSMPPWIAASRRCRQLRRQVRELEARLGVKPVVGEAPLSALDNGLGAAGTVGSRAVASRADEEPV
jgi:uncharacterized integral membrane protein